MLSLIALTAVGAGAIDVSDPSLLAASRVVPHTQTATAFQNLPPILVSEGGVTLFWWEDAGEFSLVLNGQPVSDLVTGIDSRGWPSFYGAWSDSGVPLVEGSVVAGRNEMEWFIELSRPDRRPRLYYWGLTDDPPGDHPKVCDCEDRINFCNTSQCNNSENCDLTNNKICKWFDAEGGGDD